MMTFLHNHSLGLLVMRLTVGSLMLFHGMAKIMHPESLGFIVGALAGFGLPSFLSYGVYVGEVIAPLLIIAGVFCRYAALAVVVNMVVAVVLVHTGDLFGLTEHGGLRLELQAFYLFGALAIVLMGSGRFAVKPD